MKTGRWTSWLVLVVCCAGFVGVAYYLLRARLEAGHGLPPYSVYSEERDGLADSARLLRQLGWEPVAVTRPMQFYPPGAKPRLLVLVEPSTPDAFGGGSHEIGEADTRGLLRWVEQGNTLLLMGRHGTELHRELGISLRGDAPTGADDPGREVTLAEAGGYTDDIDHLVVEGADSLFADKGLPLWWLDDRPAAIVVRRGQGRVIVVADPSLLTKRGLRRQDNVMFLYNVADLHARDGRVYFDEYHHGLRSGGGFWGYLRFNGLLWALLPILAATLVGIWALAVRLGPAVPQAAALQADAVAYASALARIYERAGVPQLLSRGLARDFVASLTKHLHLRRSALPAEILAAWRQRQPAEAGQVQELLRGIGDLRQRDISERRLFHWVRAFDAFTSRQLAPVRTARKPR